MTHGAHDFRDRMACLADESRFRIVLSLAAAEQCVSELARNVGLSQSCTTRHLQALARRGLVRGDRRGRQVVFALQFDAPEIRVVLQAFDPEAADARTTGAMLHVERPSPSVRRVDPPPARTSRPARPPLRGAGPAEPVPVSTPVSGVPVFDLEHSPASDAATVEPEVVRPMTPVRSSDLEDYLL
jgi:DNA-binding transcriptional ArsR family regulator